MGMVTRISKVGHKYTCKQLAISMIQNVASPNND